MVKLATLIVHILTSTIKLNEHYIMLIIPVEKYDLYCDNSNLPPF